MSSRFLSKRGLTVLRALVVLGMVCAMLIPAGLGRPAYASSVSSAVFTGGTGTVSAGGTLYAKNGGALTLTVNTSSDTKCVDVSGAFTGHQQSGTAQSTWTFSFTAGSGNGVQTVTASARPTINNQNNCTGQQGTGNASYVLDNAGPTVTATVAPAPNAAGWNNSTVSVTWAAVDGGSGVASGPTPANDSVAVDTAGVTKTASATDRLGNTGSGAVTVKRDTAVPSISGSAAPPANANGWNNTNVTVSFTCSDALSGIKSCTGSTNVTSNGSHAPVAGSAVDNADNSANATVSGIQIDKALPTLSGAPTSSPNGAGWYNSNVTIHWTATDTFSGLDPATIPADSTISGEGTGLTANASVSDLAGNTTTATSSPSVKIDKTAPNTTAGAPPAWNNTAVTVSLSASDALSGVAATYYTLDGGAQQPGTSVAISDEGMHSLQFWSVDNAGNTETPKSVQVKIDLTSPTIGHTQAPPANGNGWNNTDVTVTFVCADGLSGIASCTDPQTVTTEGQNQAVTGTATDNAGNTVSDPASVSIDKTAPTISGNADRPANGNGWYNADVTVSFSANDTLSGIDTVSPPATLGEGANQSVMGSATDAAGNRSNTTVSDINVDETAPSLTGAVTTSPNTSGWYNADVTIAWTCGDALSGIDGACPGDSTITGEGSNLSASASVSDLAGNTTNETVSGIQIDRTAPVTQASAPPPGAAANGWYGPAGVEITLHVVDALSGGAATYYQVDGGGAQSYSGPFTFSTGGIHTLTFWSADNAGNTEDAGAPGHSLTVQIDTIAPSINGSRLPAANANGWNNGPVTVSFACADAESGLASCSGNTTLTGEGANQAVSGTAQDNVGNMSSATVDSININLTAPTLSGAPTTAPNAAGWYNSNVTIHWTATDGHSGVDPASQPADSTISAEGTSLTASASVSDLAGNSASATSSPAVKIDKTAPTITGAPTTSPNASGWYKTNVVIHFTCSDALSGIATCPADMTLSAEGTNQSAAGTALDNAGNSASYTVSGINIDKTGPTITGAPTTSPNANGWYKTNVVIHFTCSDALSGIATCPADVTLTTEGANQSATGTAVDTAGNTASYAVSGINIDKTGPTVTIGGVANNGTYTLGVVPSPSCSASDTLSGLAAPCTGSVTGGLPNGVGSYSYTASATDRAGNTTTVSATYHSIYRWDGFLQPINDTAHQQGPLSIFKAGSTVPTKFQLKTASGAVVQANSLPVWVTPALVGTTSSPVDESTYTDQPSSGNTYRWDSSSQQYIYNYGTPRLVGNVYRIGVTLDDGQTYYVNIGLR